jgi:hypothetical protein
MRALVGMRLLRQDPNLQITTIIQHSSVMSPFILWCASIQIDIRSDLGVKYTTKTQVSEQERDKLIFMNWLARVDLNIASIIYIEYHTNEINTGIQVATPLNPPPWIEWFAFILHLACAKTYHVTYGAATSIWPFLDSQISASLRYILLLLHQSRKYDTGTPPEKILTELLNDFPANMNQLMLIAELTSLYYSRMRMIYLRRSQPPFMTERANKRFNDTFRNCLLF